MSPLIIILSVAISLKWAFNPAQFKDTTLNASLFYICHDVGLAFRDIFASLSVSASPIWDVLILDSFS